MAENDVVGLRITGRFQSQNIVHTLHYQITAQTSDDHEVLQNLCDGWDTKFTSAWVARHCDGYLLIGCKGFGKTGNNKRPGFANIETAGSVVAGEVPSPVCRTITLYTDSDNHWRRGRLMLSGCSEDMFNDNDGGVTDVEQTALLTLAGLLLETITESGDTFQPVLPAGVGVGGEYPVENITSYLIRRTPACIRSRRVRGFSVG